MYVTNRTDGSKNTLRVCKSFAAQVWEKMTQDETQRAGQKYDLCGLNLPQPDQPGEPEETCGEVDRGIIQPSMWFSSATEFMNTPVLSSSLFLLLLSLFAPLY